MMKTPVAVGLLRHEIPTWRLSEDAEALRRLDTLRRLATLVVEAARRDAAMARLDDALRQLT